MAFVHVLWSASEFTGSIYSYRVLPWAIGKPEPSQNWPEPVQRYWIQAKDSLQSENWDAAALMARSALQLVMRDKGANGGTLKAEIKDLVEKKILLPTMEDWSTEVRELGNESAHPSAKTAPTEPQDARDVVQFLDYLLLYLYDLPKQIADYRSRKAIKHKSDPGKI